jgi:hypothetical protein
VPDIAKSACFQAAFLPSPFRRGAGGEVAFQAVSDGFAFLLLAADFEIGLIEGSAW